MYGLGRTTFDHRICGWNTRSPANHMLLKITALLVFTGSLSGRDPQSLSKQMESVLALAETGYVDPLIFPPYDFTNGGSAIQDLADRKNMGEGYSPCRMMFLKILNHLNVYRDGKVLYVEIDNPPINLITVPLLFDFINLTKWVEDDEDSTVLVLKSVVDGFFIAHFDVGALLTMDSNESRPADSLTTLMNYA